jgi:hypothetical protein
MLRHGGRARSWVLRLPLMPAAAEVHLHPPQTLYRHWEERQWNPFAIDLATDAGRASADEIRTFALTGLNRRLKIIAVDLG